MSGFFAVTASLPGNFPICSKVTSQASSSAAASLSRLVPRRLCLGQAVAGSTTGGLPVSACCRIFCCSLGMFGVNAALMAMPEASGIALAGVVFLGWLAVQACAGCQGRNVLKAESLQGKSLRGWFSLRWPCLAEPAGLSRYASTDSRHRCPATGCHQLCRRCQQRIGCLVWLAWAGRLWLGSFKTAAWRIIDGLIGVMMALIALQLAIGS